MLKFGGGTGNNTVVGGTAPQRFKTKNRTVEAGNFPASNKSGPKMAAPPISGSSNTSNSHVSKMK